MELTRAERYLAGQIVNIKLDNATLKDHITLEEIYKKIDPENIEYPNPVDYINEEDKHLFDKYEGQRIEDIEDENDREKLQAALTQSRKDQSVIWSNQGGDEEDIPLTEDQKGTLLDFFEQDKRSWPREYHKAIVSLYDKLDFETGEIKK